MKTKQKRAWKEPSVMRGLLPATCAILFVVRSALAQSSNAVPNAGTGEVFNVTFTNAGMYDIIVRTSAGESKTLRVITDDLDSDKDQLPDWWEMKHLGSLVQTGAGDPDEDGLSNLDEYRLNTDPMDGADGRALLEDARRRIAEGWRIAYGEEPVFANTPGSTADLEDMRNSLNALSGKFYRMVNP